MYRRVAGLMALAIVRINIPEHFLTQISSAYLTKTFMGRATRMDRRTQTGTYYGLSP
jgi:hypothetical protein